MIFAIERVSEHYTYDESEPDNFGNAPCPEAKLIKTPLYVRAEFGDPRMWVVYIGGLEELVDFCKRHRRVILDPYYWKFGGITTIRIYDDYVE